MTIRNAVLKVMQEKCNVLVSQEEILLAVVQLTGYSYESCRGNSFRNLYKIPEIREEYSKEIIKRKAYYIKKEKTNWHQDYQKPLKYYQLLEYLNQSKRIYTLAGTDAKCCTVLDKSKTIKVDISPHVTGENILRKNIYKIKDIASYNLDFEGYLNLKRVTYINTLPFEYLLLTYQKSCHDNLFQEINAKLVDEFEYVGKSNRKMRCCLFKH